MWELIKTKTPDFTRGKLHERVKLFSMQRKIGGFHKDFYIKRIEKLSYHYSYYKILGKPPILRCMENRFTISWSFPRVKSGVLVLINSSYKKQVLLYFPLESK